MGDSITIQLNGKPAQVSKDISITELLGQKGISPNVVACELNLKIIKRANLKETKLHEGDALEIIQMIGGG